jgi:hypothetical protein
MPAKMGCWLEFLRPLEKHTFHISNVAIHAKHRLVRKIVLNSNWSPLGIIKVTFFH